jgi:SAM-dependent methyltransferase
MLNNVVQTGEEKNYVDSAKMRYAKARIAHWDRISPRKENPKRVGNYYHHLVHQYYRFFIPSGLRVLELGCGHGNLLAALEPSFGVGVDFSCEMLRCAARKYPHLHFLRADAHAMAFRDSFDIIILSDLVNDLWDVQQLLEIVRTCSHSGTKVVINFYNNLWRIPLAVANRLGIGAEMLEQNWFAPQDIFNLLELAGFDVVHRQAKILLPLRVPFLSALANRYLVHFIPFSWFAMTNIVIARPSPAPLSDKADDLQSVSVVIPARNEAGNIETILKRVPEMGSSTELVFVEGHSTDKTYETIQHVIAKYPGRKCKLFRQSGKGKGDAVRLGFQESEGDVLMILDADMTVPPEELTRFFEALASGKGEFINGVRLVYPLEDEAMRFFNILGNKFFSLAFTWLLGQPIKDTLCGTKVLRKKDYDIIAANRNYFGDFDPFGDFDLLFGAAKLNLKISEIPIRYRSRSYGDTNISRWRHGWLLVKMVVFAARRIKFI